ncbi:AMP-binding protein [Streptomyces sp. NPDC048430]|uniref:AMP-binding protein n=1 Tax=Streptomyces sp. NPDC048430 TaxID=3155388 RepID=UPI0034367553
MVDNSTAPAVGTTGFYAFAAAHPDRTAIIDTDGTQTSFGELLQRVNGLSHAFLGRGLRPGDVVAGVLHNGKEFFEVLLAAAQLGLYFVPVNWRLTAGETGYILRNSGAKLVIVDSDQAAGLAEGDLPAHRFSVHETPPGWEPYDKLGAGEPVTAPQERHAGAMMGYTSGTTGNPKGVKIALPPVSPEQLAELMIAQLVYSYGIEPSAGIHLVCSPVYHSAPGTHALCFLQAGHTLLLHSRFDAELALRDVEKYHVTSTHMVPTQFIRLLRLPDEVRGRYDLSSLQAVIHAGAPCPETVKRRMLDWVGPIVWEYMGSAEGGVSRVSPQEWLTKPGTVGRPVPGIVVRILDEDGRELPTGQSGLIYTGATDRPPSFEYLGDPAKTADNRRGDLYTVGDIGYLDEDGYLFLQDRRTDLIISGGVNIYPAEIENRLIEHPSVADAAVVGVPDPEWGHSVVAVVELVENTAATTEISEELQRFCEAGLAKFKLPRRIEIVNHLPRTPAGKLQRRVVRDMLLTGQQ